MQTSGQTFLAPLLATAASRGNRGAVTGAMFGAGVGALMSSGPNRWLTVGALAVLGMWLGGRAD